MSRQQDNYIHSQLEPEDILITGNAKKWHLADTPERIRFKKKVPDQPVELEAESNKKQDEYLQRFGL